jgi:hypothetical protein
MIVKLSRALSAVIGLAAMLVDVSPHRPSAASKCRTRAVSGLEKLHRRLSAVGL